MPTLHNRERDMSDYRDQRSDDREISLGTGTILGIFFALALLCAIFFGFGYSMGRKSAQTSTVAAETGTGTSSGIFSAFKPSAGNPVSQPAASTRKEAPAVDSQASSDADAPASSDTASEDATPPTKPVATAPRAVPQPAPAEVPAAASVRQSTKSEATPAPAPAMPAITPNGTAMVQVAAVSHQEDADVLLSALKKKGYAVFIRQEPQDHLLHVQIGPFATRKDADTMRQHLLSDGYNAIVK
jgi:cell division septation protein DedD